MNSSLQMVDLQCLMTIVLTVHLVLQDNSTNDISSHDGPHVASGQQPVTSSTAPPKIAARRRRILQASATFEHEN